MSAVDEDEKEFWRNTPIQLFVQPFLILFNQCNDGNRHRLKCHKNILDPVPVGVIRKGKMCCECSEFLELDLGR